MAYSPAGNTTGSAGLAHLQSILYKKKGLDRLQKKFVFRGACDEDQLSLRSGRTAQWFRYSNFSANTTPTTEGTIGTSLSLTTKIVGATVSQYTAFITVSDFLQDTAIDPIVKQAADLLGYQAGLSVDTMTRNVIDAEFGGCSQTLLGTYTRVADLRAATKALSASDVQPFDDETFFVVMHPFVTYDFVNDPAAGGLADIVKYTNPASSPLMRSEDRGTVMNTIAGCRVIESTNVKITSGTPNLYRIYIFGKHGVGCLDLEGRGPSNVKDPRKQSFNINVVPGKAQIADPEFVIGAAVSYNFCFTTVVLDGPPGIGGTYRMKQIDAQSSIG